LNSYLSSGQVEIEMFNVTYITMFYCTYMYTYVCKRTIRLTGATVKCVISDKYSCIIIIFMWFQPILVWI